MTRGAFKAHGGPTTRRRGDPRAPRRPGRFAALVRVVCLLLCLAPALGPSLLVLGRAAPPPRAEAGPQSSPADSAAHSLLDIVASIAAVLRPPAPARGGAVGIPAAHLSAYEPEPAAATIFLSAPTGLSVGSTSDSQVALSWPPVSGAVGYRVERSPNLLSPYSSVGNPASNGFQDSGVTRGDTYLYRVRAVDSTGALSPPSAVLMATAITFTDPELVGANDNQGRRATTVKAVHVNDLRAAVAGVRRAALLPAAQWQEAVSTGVPVRAEHVRELRRNLDEALSALGLPVPAYTDPTLYAGRGGTRIKKVHFEELRSRSVSGAGVSGSGLAAYDFASARLDPSNRTGGGGVDLLSRNFNWSFPLVSLPGRAGLDLGLSLAYNSLVWTKSGDYVLFDGDWGWPAPGFRLGFPVVQGKFFDAQAQKDAYLLLTPSGARVSLRQTTTAGVYEAGDSSYLQLTEEAGGGLTLRSTDGMRMSYRPLGGVYKCAEVKDRQGNFITVSYNSYDNVESITDTLGRAVSFGYYGDGSLKEITQTWHREVEGSATVTETHKWAQFYYADKAVRTNFAGLTVFGPSNGQSFHALTRLKLEDDSSFTFNYTTWGQVNQVAGYAPDGRLLNYVSLDLPADETTAQTDCPRPTQRRDWAAYWNGDADGAGAASEEAVTSYSVADGVTWQNPETGAQEAGRRGQQTTPDGTVYKVYAHASGWDEGMVRLSEVWSGGARKKWTSASLTQDDESLTYQQNPRLKETNVYDSDGNRRRTEVVYTSFGLPQDVKEYDANASTVLRRTHTEYVPESVDSNGAYTLRRIIGLTQKQEVYGAEGGQEKLYSKVTFGYDLANAGATLYLADVGAVAQHDNSAYGAAFATRGNLCRIRRWDATDPLNLSKTVFTEAGYDTLGSALFTSDAAGHKTTISYTDSDGGARLAYPTKVTDPDGFSASTWYNYDMGVVIKAVTPKPNVATNQAGPEVQRFYDAAGRALKVKRVADGAYTKWEYGAGGLYAKQLTKVDSDKAETFVLSITDGAGRGRASLRELPGSAGGYAARRVTYDVMGRQSGNSNPIEVSADANDLSDVGRWQPAGEDATGNGGAGWVYATQTYDWKGRPLVTTNTDGTTRESSYGGCGCAGGEVVTLTDEVGRRRKVYSDALGRQWKVEALTLNGTVYSATTTAFDALDHAVRVRQYAGAAPSPEPGGEGSGYQTAQMTYDGHGRLKTAHRPEQVDANNQPTSSAYDYNADDTVHIMTDARGATTTYSYNGRRLVTGIEYGVAQGFTKTWDDAPGVSYAYDAAGNRTSMSDGLGGATYHYDSLSRVDWEERALAGVGAYTLSYTYTLSGKLKTLSEQFGAQVGYVYDQAGKITGVTGAGFGDVTQYASEMRYRAWGALKHMKYGNGRSLDLEFDAKLQTTHFRVSGVAGSNQPGFADLTYQYDPDGRVHSVHDATDNRYDRAYSYDHVGRLTTATSGIEAGGGGASVEDSPYRQEQGYDAWDNLTSRGGRQWSKTLQTFHATYANGRMLGGGYNADGRPTLQGTLSYTYDAAGRVTQVTDTKARRQGSAGFAEGDAYDGDGRRVRRTRDGVTTYHLYSSVLGQPLTELDASGQKTKGYVYAGHELLAEQNTYLGVPFYRHREPSASHDFTSYNRADGLQVWGVTQLDPVGDDAGEEDPYLDAGGGGAGLNAEYPDFGDVSDPGFGCEVDGIPWPCQMAFHYAAVMHSDVVYSDSYGQRRLPGLTGAIGAPNYVWAPRWVDSVDNRPYSFTYGGQTYADNGASVSTDNGYFVPVGGDTFTTQTTPQNLGPTIESDLRTRITIVRANNGNAFEENQKKVLDRIERMADSKECNDAFKNAGLPTPRDIINRGLTLGSSFLLTDPQYNKALGISETDRHYYATIFSGAGLTFPQTDNGTPTILLSKRAFDQDGRNVTLYYGFDEVIVHEFIHAAGVAGKGGGYLSNDLNYYKYYDSIIDACLK